MSAATRRVTVRCSIRKRVHTETGGASDTESSFIEPLALLVRIAASAWPATILLLAEAALASPWGVVRVFSRTAETHLRPTGPLPDLRDPETLRSSRWVCADDTGELPSFYTNPSFESCPATRLRSSCQHWLVSRPSESTPVSAHQCRGPTDRVGAFMAAVAGGLRGRRRHFGGTGRYLFRASATAPHDAAMRY